MREHLLAVDRALDLAAEEEEVAGPAEAGVVRAQLHLGLRLAPRALHAAPARDDGADLDLVVVLDHLAVGEELVAADDHGGAGQDAELGEQAAHGPTPGDLDRAPLGVQMDPHATSRRVPRARSASRHVAILTGYSALDTGRDVRQ